MTQTTAYFKVSPHAKPSGFSRLLFVLLFFLLADLALTIFYRELDSTPDPPPVAAPTPPSPPAAAYVESCLPAGRWSSISPEPCIPFSLLRQLMNPPQPVPGIPAPKITRVKSKNEETI